MEKVKDIYSRISEKISSKQEIIFYTVFIFVIAMCITVASIISDTAHHNRNLYPYTAFIINTDCKYSWDKNNGWITTLYFILVYTVDSVKYMQKYKTEFFSKCEMSTWGGEIDTCCESMIGDEIWFNVNDKNVSSIKDISITGNDSSGTLIVFAFFFYVFSVIGLFVLIKVAYVHYRDGELNFSAMTRIPLLNKDDGL